jgi:hypothetical protein
VKTVPEARALRSGILRPGDAAGQDQDHES